MFELNPLYYDVPQAHLVAALDAQLEQLDKAAAVISSAVDYRVHEYRSRLEALTERLQIAKKKIANISASKEGIVIYSAGAYPLPREKQEENFKRLLQPRPVEAARTLADNHRPPANTSNFSDGLTFLYVKPQADAEEEIYRLPPKGLGKLRDRRIQNVADILLFNEIVNPYSDDPPSPEKSPPPMTDDVPSTYTLRDSLSLPLQFAEGSEAEKGIMYDPGMSQTPDLLLPQDLPLAEGFVTDLPNLFPSDSTASFSLPVAASSLANDFPRTLKLNDIDSLPQLPDISHATPLDAPVALPPAVSTIISNSTRPSPAFPLTPPAPSAVLLPTPPPPPPPPTVQSAPAPAPPPSPSTLKATPSPGPISSPEPSLVGDRSSLLDAIRSHGGVKGLKSANKENKRALSKKAAAAPAMDHMAALKERLKRREISSGSRPIPPQVTAPPPQSSGGILEAVMNKIKKSEVMGSDSDDPPNDNESEWD